MALQLPPDVENEILSRLPPHSLVRLRSVCKRWNSLLKDKSFVNNHFSRSRPQFMLRTNTKVYLVDIINLDPNSIGSTLELRDLHSYEIPLMYRMNQPIFDSCDEFLFCMYGWKNMIELWNPWLKQVKRFEYKFKDEWFYPLGIGYDNTKPEKAYKVLGKFFGPRDKDCKAAIFYCASQVLKVINSPDNLWRTTDEESTVSLNGNLYWVSVNRQTQKYFIQSFDFSMEKFKPFSLILCQKSHYEERLVLAAFKGDRLSLLKRPYQTKEIEIWVTEKTITREEKDMVWIKLMTSPTTNLPRLFNRISYLIHDKTLFMCCDDYIIGFSYIYIVREDLCQRIQIEYGIDTGIGYCRHSVYTPNFISVPYFRG